MNFDPSEEELAFRAMVRRWVEAEAPKSWARQLEANEDEYPYALWDKLTGAGFHGVGIPEEYGGQGGDIYMQMTFARELARTLGGMLWIWGVTSFAGGKSIGVYGSEEQKRRFLPDIAAGRLRVSIAFTESGGGTDVLGALRTSATRVDGGWLLNGEKMWSSGSHAADYLLTLVRTDRNVAKRHHGVSVFFVPAKQKGITITPLKKLGMRGVGSCIVRFDDVVVPDDLVLGEPGKAWYTLLPTLNNERIMVGAQCLGAIDGILEDAIVYAGQRQAFGRSIGAFQAIQHYIADIAMWQREVELMLRYTATLQATGRPCGTEANMLKLMATERAVQAADLGIQILGGMGYSSETDMQRYWRDHRILRMTPISNEMVRNTIAESLGLPRSF